MARQIDRIEKEVGYCEIKLEKERRLRKQIAFLKDDLEALNHVVAISRNANSGENRCSSTSEHHTRWKESFAKGKGVERLPRTKVASGVNSAACLIATVETSIPVTA